MDALELEVAANEYLSRVEAMVVMHGMPDIEIEERSVRYLIDTYGPKNALLINMRAAVIFNTK